MRLSLAPLFLSLLAPHPQTGVQTSAPGIGADGASTYRNDILRLSYMYPSSYTDASALVAPAFEASMSGDPNMAATAHCVTLPFSRMNTGNGQIAMLLLVRADAACMKKKFDAKSLPELTQGEAQGLAASGAKTSFGKPVSFQVAGKPANLLQGSFTLPTGQSLNAMVVCVLDQPDVACWQFLSNTPGTLKTLSAFPVTFDGQPAAPLVPQDIAARP